MPEGPEVERVRLSLEPVLVGARVVRTRLCRRDVLVVPGDPEGGFARQRAAPRPRRATAAHLLAGATIEAVKRRGKQLAVVARKGPVLLVHLGMTGQVRLVNGGARFAEGDHLHALWWLLARDGSAWRMAFRDPRRFGGMWALPDARTLEVRWAALGPDGLEITPEALAQGLAGSARPLKAALLDQGVVAGVGNIYADEACFAARLDPHRLAGTLSDAEAARLARAIRGTLERAIQRGGSTLRDYADARGERGQAQADHAVYGRAGRPCLTCGHPLAHSILAQRATVWCPSCQG